MQLEKAEYDLWFWTAAILGTAAWIVAAFAIAALM
jgi:hypothetical protein